MSLIRATFIFYRCFKNLTGKEQKLDIRVVKQYFCPLSHFDQCENLEGGRQSAGRAPWLFGGFVKAHSIA